jgi:hypothetical protein
MVESVNLDAVKNIITDDKVIIKNIRAFLRDCYVEHGGWKIPASNPSKIREEIINNIKQLVDDYDYISTWFSLNYHNQLIACARLCGEDANGLLELERYQAAKQSLTFLFNKKREMNIIELNREAVHPWYFKTEVFFLLLNNIFTYCVEKNYSILTTTSLSEWDEIYQYIGFPQLKDKSFKYHEEEPKSVKVFFADQTVLIKLVAKLQSFLKQGGNYVFKTSCLSLAE